MVDDSSPWVVALSSDTEDDYRPPNRRAADNGATKENFLIDEDIDVQILTVLNAMELEELEDFVKPTSELPGMCPNKDCHKVFQFAAIKDPLKQRDAVFSQSRSKRNQVRRQRRLRAALRLEEDGGNGAQVQLKPYVVPERYKEQGTQVRGVPSATTGLGFIDMERLVTGSNIRDWCHSLRMCHGPELSNLHFNIIRFCRIHELTAEQVQIRRDALEYVKQAVFEIWPSAEVHLFGSTATGLALPSSDIDVVVISPIQSNTCQKASTKSWIPALSANLKRHGKCLKIRKIPFAKVPLIKVKFRSGVACDISFDVPNGVRGVPVIREFIYHYEALRPLCLVLKFLLGHKNLNELYTGGLGSFCLINMVVSHLQNLEVSGSGHDLGILLVAFFVHFSVMHNYRTGVVCTRPGYCAPKHIRGWVRASNPELLSCEDPLDPTSDIARGSYRIQEIRKLFVKARTSLLVHWHDEDVLSHILDTSQPAAQLRHRGPQAQADVTPARSRGRKKKSKKKRKKMKPLGVTSGDEDGRSRKIARLIAKSVQQVSDSPRRRPSASHRPEKLQKRKKKERVERIYVDFWGNQVNTKHKNGGKVDRKESL